MKHTPRSRGGPVSGFAQNAAFLVPAPAVGDTRPRNAFGMLEGFGEAYAAYYAEQDRKRAAEPAAPSRPVPWWERPIGPETTAHQDSLALA